VVATQWLFPTQAILYNYGHAETVVGNISQRYCDAPASPLCMLHAVYVSISHVLLSIRQQRVRTSPDQSRLSPSLLCISSSCLRLRALNRYETSKRGKFSLAPALIGCVPELDSISGALFTGPGVAEKLRNTRPAWKPNLCQITLVQRAPVACLLPL
jgi:hypothetical protein